jgi:hypothetical protein
MIPESKQVTVTLWPRHAQLVEHALINRLEAAKEVLEILRRSDHAPLTQFERNKLPDTLKDETKEELVEQIDSWRSLINQIECVITDFKV